MVQLPICQIENLYFSYSSQPLLEEVSLSIPTQKITVIIGPNGCGKTTLLKLICGLQKPHKGEIILNNQTQLSLSHKEMAYSVSFMGQQTPKISLTTEQFIELGRLPHQRGISPFYTQKDKEICHQIMKDCHILHLKNRPLAQMSAGQRQLTALAKQLAQESALMLLDEPTANLDPKHQKELLELVKESVKRGKSALLVMHDLTLAANYADHIILMKEGAIIAEGSPREVYQSDLLTQLYETPLKVQYLNNQIIVLPLV